MVSLQTRRVSTFKIRIQYPRVKDHLSTISMVIIKGGDGDRRMDFSQCQGLRSTNYAFRLKKTVFIYVMVLEGHIFLIFIYF